MGKKLYVGNLPFTVTEDALRQMFADCGTVESAKIITDKFSGRSKGFGFVEMSSDAEAATAITKFNGMEHEGRKLNVNEARPLSLARVEAVVETVDQAVMVAAVVVAFAGK